MSLRNFVSSYPQLSVNAPPPHHQTHRVQALPVSVATALQQQMSQQQSQGSQQNNPNGSSNANIQQTPSHEFHVAHLPFQTPAGTNIAPNYIRHMSNGAYPTHPQNPYQNQGGPNQQPQQQPNNPAQSIQNTAPSSQPRLTPMAPPTAPPTPPTQQQPQSQQPQYVAQGGAQPTRSAASYPRTQTANVRRPQQPQPQQYIYSQIPPYNFVIPNHIRPAVPLSAQPYPTQVFAPQIQQFAYYQQAPQSYQQMPAPTSNGQRQPATASSGPPSMPAANEYSQYVYDPSVMPVMPQQPAVPPPQKTTKKSGSKALTIINPATGKSIFEEDSSATINEQEKVDHKEEIEKENSDPSTPVVSAMSDGPSVDITPKHSKKNIKKPPETIPQLSDPPKRIETTIESVEVISQDNENNNGNNTTEIMTEPLTTPKSMTPPVPIVEEAQMQHSLSSQPQLAPVSVNSNDTNNNNYQKGSADENENGQEIIPEQQIESDEIDRAVVIEPQDTNNNSNETEEKPAAVIEGPIDYDDDQWSPANQAGKKYYTRDQLLKLKDAVPVPPIKLPEGVANTLLKNNKECLTNTLNQTMPPMGMRLPFDAINSLAPKFMNNQLSGRNPYPNKRPSQQGMKQQASGRGSQSGSDRQIIKLNLSLQDNVKLNEAENAWKPSHLQSKPELSEEERQTHEVLNKFRSMLNKLTAENFDILVEQCRTFKFDTTERLDGVIRLLFEKAISEPKFAPTYANLCKEIATIQTVPSNQQDPSDKQTKKNTLKVRLITQCQKEFERNKEDTAVFREIEEKLRENENEPNPEKREEQKVALEEEHYKLRQRANGTVKFIGELYKIDMLTSKIMRTCIEMLLSESTEEKVERVCKLLTTIGSKMEAADGRQSLNKYFHILSDMTAASHKTIKSSRIKFEIQNLEDLRNNNWKARRQDLTPKTMDQMHWEAEQEQQMINYQTRQSAKEDRQRGGRDGFNKRQQPQQDNDGWSVQQNTKSRAQPIQLAKISLPSMSDSSAKLGNASQFQNFMMQTNKFAGLAVDGESEPPRFGGGGSKNSSMERGDRGSRFYGNGSDNRYGGRGSSNQGSRNSSQIRSRDNSGSRGGSGGPSRSLQAPPRHQVPPISSMSFSGPPAIKKPPTSVVLTEEEVEKMVKELVTVVDAYRDDKLTLEGAIEKVHKVSINKDVLIEIYNKFLDRKDNDRENLMLLIVEMLKQKMVMREDNKLALHKVMELAPDFQCDVPRVYEYIAQFMSELLIASVLTFQEVYQICQAEECDKENVLRYIFTAVDKRHGANKLQHIVAESNCDLGQFIKDKNFGRWLEANKFTNMVRRGTRGIADVMAHLKKMILDKCTNDSVMEYISSTDCSKDPNFIRQLTIVVMECCCDEYIQSGAPQQYKLNNIKLEPLTMLLQRYIDNDMNRELQCIYALQNFAFVREYPPGFLNSIFDVLYDNDVLSADAFESWKKSDDQTEGKGVAVCSTRQFFTKLAEDEDDDEEDTAGSN